MPQKVFITSNNTATFVCPQCGNTSIVDVSKYLGSASNNYAQYENPLMEDLHARMSRSGDENEQRTLMRQFENELYNEQSHIIPTLWWYKINPHRSYVKGWKIAPSHYLNQHLDQVWLDK